MSVTDQHNKKWYFKHNGETYGPLPFSALREASFSGLLQPEDAVRVDGTKVWTRAETLNFWGRTVSRLPQVQAEPGLPDVATLASSGAETRAAAVAASAAAAAEEVAGAESAAVGRRASRRKVFLAGGAIGLLILLLGGGIAGWWWLRERRASPAAAPVVAPVAPPPSPSDPRALADDLRLGRGVARDPAAALAEYGKLATQGDAVAQRWVGFYGVFAGTFEAPPDFFAAEAQRWQKAQVAPERVRQMTEAMAWLEKAAKQNDGAALYGLACLAHWGIGAVADPVRAHELVSRAASCGDADATYALALLSGHGSKGVPPDFTEMVRLAERAAAGGHVPAQVLASRCYQDGRGVPKDLNRAASLVRIAADQGNPQAQYQLSRILRESADADQVSRSRSLLEKAAAGGCLEAKIEFGLACVHESRGNDALVAEGVKLLEQAADSGTVSVWSELMRLYRQGGHVARDPARAADYARRVLRVEADHVEANATVGEFLLDSQQDRENALRHLLIAAWSGNARAAWRLGRALYDGEADIIRQQMAENSRQFEAARWWKEAAWNGSLDGLEYLEGYGLQNLAVPRKFNSGLEKAEDGLSAADLHQALDSVTSLLMRCTILTSLDRLESWCENSLWPEAEKATWSFADYWRLFVQEQSQAAFPQVGGRVRFRLASGAERNGMLQAIRENGVQVSGKWFPRNQIHPDDWVLFDPELQATELDVRLAGQRSAKFLEWRDLYRRYALEKAAGVVADRAPAAGLPAGSSRAEFALSLLLVRRFMVRDAGSAPELRSELPAAAGKLHNLDGLLTDAERQRGRALWRSAVLSCWVDGGVTAAPSVDAPAGNQDWLPAADRGFQP